MPACAADPALMAAALPNSYADTSPYLAQIIAAVAVGDDPGVEQRRFSGGQ